MRQAYNRLGKEKDIVFLSLGSEDIIHPLYLTGIEVIDLNTFTEAIGSKTIDTGSINWNVLNCEVGYRYQCDNTEITLWSSEFVYPNGVPHHMKQRTLGIHRILEDGASQVELHKFISTVCRDIFQQTNIFRLYTWLYFSSPKLLQTLINIGWKPDYWYMYNLTE